MRTLSALSEADVCSHDSKFAASYKAGMKKSEYWQPTLEDSLDCVAKSFTIAARIYRNLYLGGVKDMAPLQKDKDLSWNFANQIGFADSAGFVDVIRLYNALHSTPRALDRSRTADPVPADHEGGNVSAHATRTLPAVCAPSRANSSQTLLDPPSPTPSSRTRPPSVVSPVPSTVSLTRRSSASSSA